MRFRLGILCVLTTAIVPAHANAYCVGNDQSLSNYRQDYYSVVQEFRRAELVVEAVVTRETWIGDDGKPKVLHPPFDAKESRPTGISLPYIGAWYEVQVTQTFKGNAPESLRLFSENSTARFWLNKGKTYLLFVSEEAFDQPIGYAFTADPCGNSAGLGGSQALVRQLLSLRSASP